MPTAIETYNSPINYVEIRHENGVISRLTGPDADKWYQEMIRCANVAGFYGFPFRGPKIIAIPPPQQGADKLSSELLEEAPP